MNKLFNWVDKWKPEKVDREPSILIIAMVSIVGTCTGVVIALLVLGYIYNNENEILLGKTGILQSSTNMIFSEKTDMYSSIHYK